MTSRSTRADVAQLAGVSKTTVTYVLSERYDIAIPELTRERVRRAAQQLGYQPHATAKALASGRTNAIMVALPVCINPYYARLLQAFERHTNAHGYHMIASTIGHLSLANVLPDLWALVNSPTDGIILVDIPAAFKPYVAEVLPNAKPFVSVGVFTDPNMDGVSIDLEAGTRAALEHLLDAQPRRLAYFGSGGGSVELASAFATSDDPRPRLYQRLMEQAGRPLEVILGNAASRKISMESLKNYVREHGCPDALFCFNDELAISAHRALRELGFRTPGDVLIVGCDGNEEGEYLDPPLSTIVQPVEAVCQLAWEFLAHRLSNPTAPRQHTTVAAELVIRGTSQPRRREVA